MSFLKSVFNSEKKEQLNKGLSTTKKSFFSKLGKAVAGKSTIDADLLDELEEVFIRSDVGVDTTLKIIDALEARVAKDKYLGTTELSQILRSEITTMLERHNAEEVKGFDVPLPHQPHVVMVVGVNGV
jgi:fused signal recognition particle receptor